MKCPPMCITLKFRSSEAGSGKEFCLWVPLFIIVPIALIILLALFLIALPFLLISLIITWNTGWLRYLWYGIPAFFKTLHALSGLSVDVENLKQKVYIAIH
jgi:hypothetical protein